MRTGSTAGGGGGGVGEKQSPAVLPRAQGDGEEEARVETPHCAERGQGRKVRSPDVGGQADGTGAEGTHCNGRICDLWGKIKEEPTSSGAKQESRSNQPNGESVHCALKSQEMRKLDSGLEQAPRGTEDLHVVRCRASGCAP